MPRCYCDPNPSWYPASRLISSITRAYPAVVTTTFDHGYTSGTLVRFKVSEAVGMFQINNLIGEITVTGGNSFSVNIDTRGFDSFAFPAVPLPSQDICPQVIPVGENTAQWTAVELNIA